MSAFLVIGYGNTLRRDDGAGPWVAERITNLLGTAVDCWIERQLLPEMAERISQAQRVVFVDAQSGTTEMQVRQLRLDAPSPATGTHYCDPINLLTLAATLFGSAAPLAWLVTIPADDFSHGEGLSATTWHHAERAVEWIATELQRFQSEDSPPT